MAFSLGDIFSSADNQYQLQLKEKGPNKDWSIAVAAMIYTPGPPPLNTAQTFGWLKYSPFRIDTSQIREGNLTIPFLDVIPASFSGEVPEGSIQSTDPTSLDREVVWVPGTLTVSAPTFSALASGAYIATWNGADGEVSGKILPSDSMGDSSQLVVTPEGTNRTVIFLGSPTVLPLINYPPPRLG